MTMHRVIQRSIPVAAVALIAAAPFVQAQRQEIFEWNGRVDREVQITMRGNQLSTREIGNQAVSRAQSRVFSQLPRQDGQVQLQVLNGRGQVSVLQQPSAQNGYTTTIRIADQSGGADQYRIAAYWQGYSNGDVYDRNNRANRDDRYPNNAGNGVGIARGRDRDDRDNRNDRNDRNDRNGGYNNGANGQYNNQTVLHWSGNVDGELEIRIQNGRVSYRNLSGAQPTSIRASGANTSSMRSGAQVAVAQNQGRGSVTVVEQPSSYNGYSTVIRVRDPQGGYGYYDFDLIAR